MKAKHGQSFFDLVLQSTGSIENAFAMSLLNGLSISDPLFIDQELIPSGKADLSIVGLWSDNNLPSTAITNQNHELIVPDDGIGAMIIEKTFIIR